MTEFPANNHQSASTKPRLLFANYGFHPRFDISLPPVDHSPQSVGVQQFVKTMTELQDFRQTQVCTAQDVYDESNNRCRVPAPAFQLGKKVFLSTKNIGTVRTAQKLDWKHSGPFSVKTVVSAYAYELTLPPSIMLNPVFHVSLLHPAPTNPVQGQQTPPPPYSRH